MNSSGHEKSQDSDDYFNINKKGANKYSNEDVETKYRDTNLKEPLLPEKIQEAPKELKGLEKFYAQNYLFCGAFAGFNYGGYNFLITFAVNNESNLRIMYLLSVALVFYWILYHGQIAFRARSKNSRYWSKSHSSYF